MRTRLPPEAILLLTLAPVLTAIGVVYNGVELLDAAVEAALAALAIALFATAAVHRIKGVAAETSAPLRSDSWRSGATQAAAHGRAATPPPAPTADDEVAQLLAPVGSDLSPTMRQIALGAIEAFRHRESSPAFLGAIEAFTPRESPSKPTPHAPPSPPSPTVGSSRGGGGSVPPLVFVGSGEVQRGRNKPAQGGPNNDASPLFHRPPTGRALDAGFDGGGGVRLDPPHLTPSQPSSPCVSQPLDLSRSFSGLLLTA